MPFDSRWKSSELCWQCAPDAVSRYFLQSIAVSSRQVMPPRMSPGKAPGASCWFGALDFPRGRPLWPRCRPRCIRSSHLATTRLRSSSCRWCSMPSRRAPRASGGPGASGISTMWRPLCVSFVDAVILPIWNGWPT